MRVFDYAVDDDPAPPWQLAEPVPLVLDESRIDQFDEAWLPVLTPDGPDVSWWSSSD
ncbi:hypothetical protein LX86_008590 [Lentzea aerocolonigenes]|nr:hypothetical protein [Lentzea aerocolonigenes]